MKICLNPERARLYGIAYRHATNSKNDINPTNSKNDINRDTISLGRDKTKKAVKHLKQYRKPYHKYVVKPQRQVLLATIRSNIAQTPIGNGCPAFHTV